MFETSPSSASASSSGFLLFAGVGQGFPEEGVSGVSRDEQEIGSG